MGVALPVIGLAASVASAGLGVYGAIQQAGAQADAAAYQAQVARNNQIIAEQNATYARQAGAAQEAAQRMRTAALAGRQRAAMAANGFDVNSGSNLDIAGSAASLGEMDALTIRSNASRTAAGYSAQGRDLTAQAGLLDMQAANSNVAGTINAASSLLGGASGFSDKWFKYKQAGVL
jgi:hypothetical protein